MNSLKIQKNNFKHYIKLKIELYEIFLKSKKIIKEALSQQDEKVVQIK